MTDDARCKLSIATETLLYHCSTRNLNSAIALHGSETVEKDS